VPLTVMILILCPVVDSDLSATTARRMRCVRSRSALLSDWSPGVSVLPSRSRALRPVLSGAVWADGAVVVVSPDCAEPADPPRTLKARGITKRILFIGSFLDDREGTPPQG